MNLKNLFKTVWGAKNEDAPIEDHLKITLAPQKNPRLYICNDYSFKEISQRLVTCLKARGHNIEIVCVKNQKELFSQLDKDREESKRPPDAIFLDVGEVGEPAALKTLDWLEKNYPGSRLPAISFLSMSTDMGINEAGRLKENTSKTQVSFTDEREIAWLEYALKTGNISRPPVSTSFREIIGGLLGIELPMDCDDDSYKEKIKNMRKPSRNKLLDAWEQGKTTSEEAIEGLKDFALGMAQSLQAGYFGLTKNNCVLKPMAEFYASTGFPVMGPAVFSIKEAEETYYKIVTTGKKPILIMNGYDPAVTDAFRQGLLSGIVVTSPYMASHLKMLCETYMISGLFGLPPSGKKSTAHDFNENAKPAAPPYYQGSEAEINGQKIKEGQELLINGNGLVINPPPSIKTTQPNLTAILCDTEKRKELATLRQLNNCFETWMAEQKHPVHRIKTNINSCNQEQLKAARGIGLVRTEQLITANTAALSILKQYLLEKDKKSLQEIGFRMLSNYNQIMRETDPRFPLKIRLFDFVHKEIFDKPEQNRFTKLYGRLDIHGGAAFESWPKLYERQIEEIFSALHDTQVPGERPIEIMMPAVRTEEDVIKIKTMIDAKAQSLGIESKQYSFGVMVETLDACKNIEAIAKHCDFISFGTNDLTQQFFDISRDDLRKQENFKTKNGYNPFENLAPEILELMKDTLACGRAVNPKLKADVCGAHAANVEAALSLFKIGINDISVSPTLGNLYALPAILNYRLYEELHKTKTPVVSASASQNVTA